jgi:hypothetical protein
MTQEKIIVLQTFNDPFQASIALDKLKESGIHAFLEDENPIGLNPLGGVELKIFTKDKEEAEKIIADLE